jgi:hypothetical protein
MPRRKKLADLKSFQNVSIEFLRIKFKFKNASNWGVTQK